MQTVNSPAPDRSSWQRSLRNLGQLASDAHADALATEASELAKRLSEGRFFVACIGQFKRGKSTLLNALIREQVLPTGVVPVTSAITILRFGAERRANVHFADGQVTPIAWEAVAEYVTEALNPGNEKGIVATEIFAPSPLLASGMCLVDTPGIGSIFAANTASTRAFIPQIDAALVVLGADPPISGEELALVEDVSKHVRSLLFVMSKADRVSDDERKEAGVFAERVLASRLGRPAGPLFEISATETEDGTRATRDWDALRTSLQTLAGDAGEDVVGQSYARGTSRIRRALAHELDEQRDALTRPRSETEKRLMAIRACVADTEGALRELRYLFKSEQDHLSRNLNSKMDDFLRGELPLAHEELDGVIEGASREPHLRTTAMDAALRIGRRLLSSWIVQIEPEVLELFRHATARFVAHVNHLIGQLQMSAERLELPESPEVDRGLRIGNHFFFRELWTMSSSSPKDRIMDMVTTRRYRAASVRTRAGQYLNRLAQTNRMRFSNDLELRIFESGRLMEGEVRLQMQSIVATAERAFERATIKHAEGAETVARELDQIAKFQSLLNAPPS